MAGAAAGLGRDRLVDLLNIRNRRGKKRLESYRDLIKVASKTAHYAEQALAASAQWSDPLSLAGAAQLAHYLELLHQVIEQTQRRVLSGEAVAAQEKMPSSKSTPILSRRALGKRFSATKCLSARGPRR